MLKTLVNKERCTHTRERKLQEAMSLPSQRSASKDPLKFISLFSHGKYYCIEFLPLFLCIHNWESEDVWDEMNVIDCNAKAHQTSKCAYPLIWTNNTISVFHTDLCPLSWCTSLWSGSQSCTSWGISASWHHRSPGIASISWAPREKLH